MLVVIDGPTAVGKSTVAGLVASRLPCSVHVSGDSLRSCTPPAARTFLGAGCTYRAAACLATSYLETGAAAVVFRMAEHLPGLGWVLDTAGPAAGVADAVVDRLGAGGFPLSSASAPGAE